MTDENKTFDEYINNLRQICIEQRKLLGLSQKKVCELLEIKYGIQKEPEKLSRYESGKVQMPSFVNELCKLYGITFPKPNYNRRFLMNVKNTVLDIANEIRIDVYNKLQKIPEFNFQENTEVLGYGLNILAMDNYYFAFVSLDEDIEARKFIYVYQRNDICIELVGRVTYYAVPVAWFLPFGDNELVGRLDSESGDLGNMAIHIQDIINVFVLNTLGNGFAHRNVELYPFEEAEEILSSMEKEGKADNFTFPLYEKYILIFENIYVYEDCRNKGCFTALMKMLYEYYGDSLTWICNTMPIFLDEDEYDEDEPEALYDLPDDLKDAKTKSQIEFNKKLLRKYDHTNTVFLDSEIPYVIRDNFFMQDKKEIEEASSYTATYKE